MASESKGSLLAKSVQKHAGRAKEKILQNLGKVDRTADEIFDEHLTNFNRQNISATKLSKEFTNYIRCVRAMQAASKGLMDAVAEVYEPQWNGYDELCNQVLTADSIWSEFSHKLGEQILIPLSTYSQQFPEMKKKIEKRNRKLIDYDSQRHSFQNLQANSSKRKDDIKITKGREQLEEARRTYEILNTELHDELPALYDSRILFLVTNLQTMFASVQGFHSDSSKVYAELESIVDRLATESQRGSYTIKKSTLSDGNSKLTSVQSPTGNVIKSNENQTVTNGSSSPISPSTSSKLPSEEPPSKMTDNDDDQDNKKHIENDDRNKSSSHKIDSEEPEYENSKKPEIEVKTSTTITTAATTNNSATDDAELDSPNANSSTKIEEANHKSDKEQKTESEQNKTINGNNIEKNANTTTSTDATSNSSNVLYHVKAIYGYEKEDVDELSFEVGDIIRVIEYDDPEDQEDGWLMGQKEGTNEKGLFPANFTRPI